MKRYSLTFCAVILAYQLAAGSSAHADEIQSKF